MLDSQRKGHHSWVLPTDLREGIPTRGHSSYKDSEPGTSSKVQKRMASVAGTDGERREMGLRRAGPCCTAGVISRQRLHAGGDTVWFLL